MQVCLVLPPLTQLNTAYPSISYLARHLRSKGWNCSQRDLGIELFLKVFSVEGLQRIFEALEEKQSLPEQAWRVLALQERHLRVIEPVIAFLQGRDPTLAQRIMRPGFLPEGPRMLSSSDGLFGRLDLQDAAKHRATLYLQDMVDLVR